MKLLSLGIFVISIATGAGATMVAVAEETVVVPGVAIEHRTESRPTVIEERHSSESRGCTSTTVHKENDAGDSRTVKKTECD
jgi:hypothetical protein